MSVSKRYTEDPSNVREVLTLYLEDPDKPTVMQIAQIVGTTFHNVQFIVNQHIDGERLKVEKALRYSRSKLGEKNPMLGKTGEDHHNFVGLVEDGHGYLMRKVDGKYVLEHRRVFAQALGIPSLPPWLDVHHINEDKKDNRLDNLALVTASGHGALHRKQPKSEQLSLWEKWESGTLRLPVTTRTSLTAS